MDKFKKFFKGKKIEKHFKKQGEGAKLGDGSSNSSSQRPDVARGSAQSGAGTIDRVAASDVAAQAAYSRLLAKEEPKTSYSQKKIQMLAKQELEKERLEREAMEHQMGNLGLQQASTIDEKELKHSNVIKGVFYTCELLGDDVALEKDELNNVLQEFLHDQIATAEEDALIPAVIMLYTLNKKDPRQTAVDTICTYLKNIAEFPDEPKYRRIRVSNKAFQDRVVKVKGGVEVLDAVGFKTVLEGEPTEAFLVIGAEIAVNTGTILTAMDTIREGQPVPIKVARDTKAFKVSSGGSVPLPHLPPDFYDLTAAELVKEQQLLKEQTDRMTSLRTREMRERDSRLRNYRYKYTLIRVRFSDRFVIQGTFGVYEPVRALREWVADQIDHPAIPFTLKCANEPLNNDDVMLGDAKLAPCAVLHLEWDHPPNGPSLKESLLSIVQPLDS